MIPPLAIALAVGCTPAPRAVFDRDVAPILELRCGSTLCHGVSDPTEVVDREQLFFDVDAEERLGDRDAAYATAKRAIVTDEDPLFSTLIRKPLDPARGGLPHAGGVSFPSRDDPDWLAIAAWIASESGGGEDVVPLDPLEQQFADDVQPALAAMTCMSAACHGPSSGVPLRFEPGVDGTFSRADTRANRDVALTTVSLDGYATQARLLKKALPIWDGGIAHKGGNRSFLVDGSDARIAPIASWICAERLAATGAGCTEAAPIRGFVFVRGPVPPEDPFDLVAWNPGTDVWFATVDAELNVNTLTNLTAELHAAPADVRDPAVDPTGRSLLFAMRTSEDEGHRLWSLDLDTGVGTTLTGPGGLLPGGGFATDRDPTFGPADSVWFVSTRDGLVGDGDRLDGELYALGPTQTPWRYSFTPHVERKPTFYANGHESAGEVGFTALRDAVPAYRRGHPFRFPPGLDTEYHQHFGVTPAEDLFFDTRELADGRYVTVVGDLTNVWGGRLGIIDRNFGPELASGVASVPVYLPPLTRLDADATAAGITRRVYRDPVALPDGRLLVAVADGPLDLSDPASAPAFRIEVLTLRERADGSGPEIAAHRALVDVLDGATDPEPVFARAPPPVTPMRWNPAETTALVRHQSVPMVQTLLGYLPPGGTKPLDERIVAVRIVEAVRQTPDEHKGATLGAFDPSAVLAELPLAADGSFYAELPAGIAVRFQALDARGLALDPIHNRWFDLHPGQVVSQGVAPALYASTCAVCHGAASGDPTEVRPAPDTLTSASLTLSRYDGRDGRRPLEPVACGESTILATGFLETVRPVFDRACVACHAGPTPAADLDLGDEPSGGFDAAYVALWRGGWVDAEYGAARHSALAEVLLGEELDADWTVATPGLAHGALTDAEQRAIWRWLDTGAPWDGGEP